MSEEKRVIHINPVSLRIGGNDNKTRKKEKKEKKQQIKVKNSRGGKSQKTHTMRKNLMNIIRDKQKQLLKEDSSNTLSGGYTTNTILDENNNAISSTSSSFNETIKFMDSFHQKEGEEIKKSGGNKRHNYTLRSNRMLPQNHPNIPPPSSSIIGGGNVSQLPPPYGCLKGGKLPTFKAWKNQTQKNVPFNKPKPVSVVNNVIDNKQSPYDQSYKQHLHTKVTELMKIEQHDKIKKGENNKNNKNNKKPKKQRRRLRRTFKVGKSKIEPNVSVLVSNRTLRNNANLQKQKLKETSMKDVKKFLLDRGFIKVGTSSPNSVLRQMYESANMICGEVKNYNPDNLLYNYFNDKD